jgi:hypothetical protein
MRIAPSALLDLGWQDPSAIVTISVTEDTSIHGPYSTMPPGLKYFSAIAIFMRKPTILAYPTLSVT